MSSLWTPGGEHRVRPEDTPGPGAAEPSRPGRGGSPPDHSDHGDAPPGGGPGRGPGPEYDLDPEEQAAMAEQLDQLRQELLSTPAEVVVANHAYGLFELAAIHLTQQPPALDQARLAIDAMAALVEGLAGRLGDPEASLRDALMQIRMAFVQISGPEGGGAATGDAGHDADPDAGGAPGATG